MREQLSSIFFSFIFSCPSSRLGWFQGHHCYKVSGQMRSEVHDPPRSLKRLVFAAWCPAKQKGRSKVIKITRNSSAWIYWPEVSVLSLCWVIKCRADKLKWVEGRWHHDRAKWCFIVFRFRFGEKHRVRTEAAWRLGCEGRMWGDSFMLSFQCSFSWMCVCFHKTLRFLMAFHTHK